MAKEGKHYMKKYNRNLWGHSSYDGNLFVYKTWKLWKPVFVILGFSTKCSTPLNLVMDYEVSEVLLEAKLILSTHCHKSNKKINLVENRPVWGLKKDFMGHLVDEIKKVIALNKTGKNIALLCVDPSIVKAYYAAKTSNEDKVIDFASYQFNRMGSTNFPISVKKVNEIM